MAFYTMVEGFNLEGISYLMLFFNVAAQFYMVSSYGQMLIDLVRLGIYKFLKSKTIFQSLLGEHSNC